MKNIADHRPIPLTFVSAAMTSSSLIASSESSGSSPLITLAVRSRSKRDLLPAHAGRAELWVCDTAQPLRREVTAGHQRDEAGEDRRSRFGRELLAGNRPHERGEVVGALRGGKAARTMCLDEPGEHRIATHQQAPRLRVISWSHGEDSIS